MCVPRKGSTISRNEQIVKKMERDSFILYKSFYEPISYLTDEQIGRLFRAIFNYQISGNENADADIIIPFRFFVNQFRIDNAKYDEICEKRRENGKKGGRPKKPNGFQETKRFSEKPKKAHNDNDNENENENENENVFSVVADAPTTPTKKRISFVPPSLEEVKAYALEIGAPEKEAVSFFDYFTSVDWVMSGGRKIKDWKSAFRHWMNNVDKFKKSSPSTPSTKARTEIPHAKPEEFKTTL